MFSSYLQVIVLFAISANLALGAAVQVGPNSRIIGGEATGISDFPWLVSVQRYGSHACAGVIYNDNTILTVAHCLLNADTKTLRIRAGSTYWNSGGVLTGVAAFKVHEGYNAKTMQNDLAVLRLASSLSFNSNIQSIGLAEQAPVNGGPAVVAGWGGNYYGSASIPNGLQSVDVEIVGQQQCASSEYGYGDEIKASMICAAGDDKGVCQGDNGGSLVFDGQLVGIYSWSRGCGSISYPGVYTDVTAFRQWITNTVDDI